MNNTPDEDNNEPVLPVDNSGEAVQTPYDRLLSRTLMQTESAQELVRSHLPPEFVAHLKPETLEQADTSFIDANLKRRFADRLFKVEMTAEMVRELGADSPQVHLLVLVDHKSAPDKNTVVQMLGYMVRIWEHSIENSLPLIPIIPWVIYNGVRPWTVAKSLSELIPVPESWKRYVPGMEIPILDVSRMMDSTMAGEPILHITLTLLKYGRRPELADMLRQVFRSVADQFEGNRASTLLDTIRKYVMSVNPAVGENEVQGIFAEFWPVKPEPGSVADQLLTKGRQEGRQEGRVEGRLEGRQEGEIKLIRTLESILGIGPAETDLSEKTLEELQRITESLQDRIQRRG
jgi:predicted transposase/invertase (TIGR01784 family)